MPLSPTETRVLQLYDQGKSYKEISSALDISLSTVKTHTHRIVVKCIAVSLRHAAYLQRQCAGEQSIAARRWSRPKSPARTSQTDRRSSGPPSPSRSQTA